MLWAAWGGCHTVVGIRPFLYFAAALARDRARTHAWMDYMALCAECAPRGEYPSRSWQQVIAPPVHIDRAAVIDKLKSSGAVEVTE